MQDDRPQRLPDYVRQSRYCIWCDEPALQDDGSLLSTSEGLVHEECAPDFIRQTGGLSVRDSADPIGPYDEMDDLRSVQFERAVQKAVERRAIMAAAVSQLRQHQVPLHYEVVTELVKLAHPELDFSARGLLILLRRSADAHEHLPGVFSS